MRLGTLQILACALLVTACASSRVQSQAQAPARNVIVMIADGADWFSWDAGAYYRNGKLGQESFEQFPVRLPVSTFPHGGGYDPRKAWDDTPIHSDDRFEGYKYVTNWATDSAAAATALATGTKTNNGALGIDANGQPVKNLSEIAIELGKSAGVITSVPLSHATPAGFVAHAGSRGSYRVIAQQMLKSQLAVVMGVGNPLDAREAEKYDYVGGKASWQWLSNGQSPWTLLQTRQEFEELAEGTNLPQRVFGVPLADSKLPNSREPGADRVPTLATMSRGALNVLNQNPQGFFLMIEGGAVDWASHNNKLDDLINELSDFYDAIDAVVAWIEAHGGWQHNLLIITTDHGNGLLLGPDSDKQFWQPIKNQGKGELPRAVFHTKNHTNELVRLYAKGVQSQLFEQLATGKDPYLKRYHPDWSGKYGDNTDVFKVTYQAMTGNPPPPTPIAEPARHPEEAPATEPAAPAMAH